MNIRSILLFIVFCVFHSSPVLAQETPNRLSAVEKKRVERLNEIGKDNDTLLGLTIREMAGLDCHVTQNQKWLRCSNIASNLCKKAGWVPHSDGSCCLQLPQLPIAK